MPYTNIGQAALGPSLYFPTGVDASSIDQPFLAYGEQDLIYPVPDSSGGVSYTGAQDKRWSFTFQDIGNDVPADTQIDRVAVTFFASMPWGKKIRPYFRTGGIKYYSGEQESSSFIVEDSMRDWIIYGNSQPTGGNQGGEAYPGGPRLWNVNPATNAPWTVAQILAGEFGFETDVLASPAGSATDTLVLGGAFLSIYWGYGTTPGGGGGGDPLPAPCGQSTTLAAAWTNYAAEILEITPSYGPLTGGTRIVIRGVNFTAGSTVTIGGVAATNVVFVDEEHYLCTTPAHAVGYADVVINEPAGSFVIKRNGFQFTLFTRGEDIRRLPSVSIRLGLNNGTNSASFSVDGNSNPPKVGEQIQLIDNEVSPRRLLFAGNVQTVTQDYEGQNTQLVWRCTAVDYTWLMNKRRPFGSYTQVSASDIVKDLVRRYAPGFTTNFVQTNLAKISVFFDGSLDLQTCLTIIARMIGGGHWYVDFRQDVHFFHIVPPNVNIPALPGLGSASLASTTSQIPTVTGTGGSGVGIVKLPTTGAPTTALTAVESATKFLSGFTMGMGFQTFQVTFVYDDGLESGYGPATNPVGIDGTKQIVFTNIPTGTAVAGRNVVKRRIYVIYNGPNGGGKRYGFVQINDNSTTGFTMRGATYSSAQVVPLFAAKPPVVAFVPPPKYAPQQPPRAALAAATSTIPLGQPEYRPSGAGSFTWTPGNFRFRVSNIYQDMTESQMGPESNGVSSNGARLVSLTSIPVGDAIEGVPVIARRIWGSAQAGDDTFFSWWIIPNNTATSATISPTTGGFQRTEQPRDPNVPTGDPPPPTQPDRPKLPIPVWPNDDGPFLENFDLPDDVTDDNPDLLRDPQVTSTVELSQIRNRVFVRGSGSATQSFVAKGATSIPVVDCWYYSIQGGQVFSEGSVIDYTGLTATSGPGSLIVPGGVPEDLHQGAPVSLYIMVEDKQSQEDLGAIEVDTNGKPTDGIHEFIITDTSLFTPAQMYLRGYAELELYSRPVTTVRYSTRDPKTRPGATVKINLTNPPVVGEFLIQDVTIDQFHDETDGLSPRYNVLTSSAKFDLNDLFFQMSQGVSSTPTNNGNGPGPQTGIGPTPGGSGGPGGGIVIIDPRDPDGGTNDDQDEEDPLYVGADVGATTAVAWYRSDTLFAQMMTTMFPNAPANPDGTPAAGGVTGITGWALNRAFSHSTGLIYVGQYTRGGGIPVRRWNGTTDELLFTVPVNPQAEQSEPVAYDSSTGGIIDWALSTDGDTLYFVAYDFYLPPPPSYGRIMSYTFSTGAVAQVGTNACGNIDPGSGWPATIIIGDGIQMFFSIGVHRVGDTDELYAGVGVAQSGFNSNASGIFKLVSGEWQRVMNLTSGQIGETPLSIKSYNGKIYAALATELTQNARIVSSPDGVTWTTELSTSAGAGGGSAFNRLMVAEGELYATSYANSGASSFVTRIHKYNATDGWTIVKVIDTQTSLAPTDVGVELFAHDSRMFCLALDSQANGKVLSSDNGRDWTDGVALVNATSQFGVQVWP